MRKSNPFRFWKRLMRRHWRQWGIYARIGAVAAGAGFMLLVPLPVFFLLVFRIVPVPLTPQMLGDLVTFTPVHYRWVGHEAMSPWLSRAAIAAEDDNFCSHRGFDWKSIDKAMKSNARGHRLRGASTISQQTARSLFLSPARNWLRKGMEAWLTVLMETLWPKQRILTAYLNLVDWGHGNFGAEAAASAYFHKHAGQLSAREAARLAAVLPDPDVWHATRPGPYVAARTGALLARMVEVHRDGLDSCVRPD